MKNKVSGSSLLFAMALVMLLTGLLFGVCAAAEYLFPSWIRPVAGFEMLRPMHVSAVLFWILLASAACVLAGIQYVLAGIKNNRFVIVQFVLWLISVTGVYSSYLRNAYGGREYWEFNPVWALPVALAWLMLLFDFFRHLKRIKQQPVYVWMWMTGLVFFLFTFIENYMWVIPYFREKMIGDMAVQWKVNGSLVGSWNQIIYGTSFYLMDRIEGGQKTGHSKLAFGMYFLGLFNLMFNWGHHIYTLPVQPYVRIVAYAVSMTEWVFLLRIFYTWKQSVSTIKRHFNDFPYRYLAASEIWIFLNMTQAIFMSVPALNLYTHGTHVTVAHAMGTTIGINTMILISASFYFLPGGYIRKVSQNKWLKSSFWLQQFSLLVFWLSLNTAGVIKGIWQMGNSNTSYASMMKGLWPCFTLFFVSGILLLLSLAVPVVFLLKAHLKHIYTKQYAPNKV